MPSVEQEEAVRPRFTSNLVMAEADDGQFEVKQGGRVGLCLRIYSLERLRGWN